MKKIKLNPLNFKKRSDLSKKSRCSYTELVKKNNLYKKIEDCSTFLDSNLYLHIETKQHNKF